MKVLVLQLARLGDIYMTWPAMSAFQRVHPDAEIHLMTRPRFKDAAWGHMAVMRHWVLPTQDILAPLFQQTENFNTSFSELTQFLEKVKAQKYDVIANMTFSPLSSFITHYLSDENTKVVGYSRFSDGYLQIPDDLSRYYYAQAGIERPNRLHLTDLFAMMLDVDLQESDWQAPESDMQHSLPEKYIVIHVGASEAYKCYPPYKWRQVTSEIIRQTDFSVVLIGADSEKIMGDQISEGFSSGRVMNLVGRTKLTELFPIIQESLLLIGCDSAPIHIAALCRTACLNLSIAKVNMHETGPRSPKSVILKARDEFALKAELVSQVAIQMILEAPLSPEAIVFDATQREYLIQHSNEIDFKWAFIKALYMNQQFPKSPDLDFDQALVHIFEANQIALSQLQVLVQASSSGKIDKNSIYTILNQVDEAIELIGQVVENAQPLVKWYQTEKTNIGPDDFLAILNQNIKVHENLQTALMIYLSEGAGLLKSAEVHREPNKY